MAKMNIVGPVFGWRIDLDSLSFQLPRFTFLRQYLYRTVPDSRQQEVYSQFASPQDQASPEFTQGTGDIPVPPSQEVKLTNVTSSIPIQVKP